MSEPAEQRSMVVAHASPGRTRLRLGWLASEPDQAVALADALVEVEGMLEVRVRPSTGSVLCLHDPETVSVDDIVGEVGSLTGAQVRRTRPSASEAVAGGGSVAGALLEGVRDLDRDLRDVTNGRVDLATLAAGFLSLGAAEVVLSKKLPIPPWFNLAWWAFCTFTAFDDEAEAPAEE